MMTGRGSSRSALAGRVAVFTGPRTSLTLAVARKLGHSGGLLAFVGAGVGADIEVRAIERQFRGRVALLDAALVDVSAALAAAEGIAAAFGRIDAWVHTLGAAPDSPGTSAARMPGVAAVTPLGLALTCSTAAMRFMTAKRHGHLLHLVTRADVGAVEIENLALASVKQTWADAGGFAGVTMSAIIFDEAVRLAAPQAYVGDRELLANYTMRAVEEEDRSAHILLEQRIGKLVESVFTLAQGDRAGVLGPYEFPGGARSAAEIAA